ncbi:hypothetical protein ACH5RR_037003 [Cinchona calisaya]|uniref:Uncharacterized protein n=1 Tax=Cinchona calisaya TaxID=153742 RepID=A0ABD2Y8I7_9GENT
MPFDLTTFELEDHSEQLFTFGNSNHGLSEALGSRESFAFTMEVFQDQGRIVTTNQILNLSIPLTWTHQNKALSIESAPTNQSTPQRGSPAQTLWMLKALGEDYGYCGMMLTSMWRLLESLISQLRTWCDFNEDLNRNEKYGGNPVNSSRVSAFQKLIDNCSFLDLGPSSGAKWLIKNGQTVRFWLENWTGLGLLRALIQGLRGTFSRYERLMSPLKLDIFFGLVFKTADFEHVGPYVERPSNKSEKYNRWPPPPSPLFKLNIGGASFGNPGTADTRGLVKLRG